MTIQTILEGTDKKYILNTPKVIIVKLNRIINDKRTPEKYKKVLQEIKGILIGKYPSEQSLKNSLEVLFL